MAEPVDLSSPLRVHVVGVGGAGMSAIAEVLATMGHQVSGSDAAGSAVLHRLRAAGVDAQVGHDAGHVAAGLDAVAVSTAIGPDNPEVLAARRLGIPVLRRADVLSALTRLRRTIGVAGTHGKTTTSALLACALTAAGTDPSFVVGGEIAAFGTGARWGSGEWLVVEADESDGTFLDLDVEIAVVTSVEPDHLEHYGSFEHLVDAFALFLSGAGGGRLVCADDPQAAALAAACGATTYGFAAGADLEIAGYEPAGGGTSFTLVGSDPGPSGPLSGVRGPVRVPMPGRHNARNATAALGAALLAGAPFAAAAAGVAGFAGVGRRSQRRGERAGVTFVDDYAHLPGEVAPALAAAREGEWGRVVCVFQPHRYSRTEALWADFADAFTDADVVVITDIYAAGEPARPGVSGRLVADAVRDAHPAARVEWAPDRASVVAFLRAELRPGDLCLTLGAGDLTTLADELLEEAT